MSEPSPADCAVTIRSFPRRVREALGTDEPATGPGRRLLDLLATTHQRLAAMGLAPDRASTPRRSSWCGPRSPRGAPSSVTSSGPPSHDAKRVRTPTTPTSEP